MSEQSSMENNPPGDSPLQFADVLKGEIWEILGYKLPEREEVPGPDMPGVAAGADDSPVDAPAPSADELEKRKRRYERHYEKCVSAALDKHTVDLSALCLSGGGIRSATFALGVMQGLARFGLLGQFHYLSSVSGGGYIASWLTAWRNLQPDPEVFNSLNLSMHTGTEAEEITGIRADSNYLTPKLGLLSADTWTLFALYFRNLLLNWILFVPFFTGCFLFPRVCATVLQLCGGWQGSEARFEWGSRAGVAFLVVGLSAAIYGRFTMEKKWLTEGRFLGLVLFALVLSGATFTLAAVAAGCSGPALPEWAAAPNSLLSGAKIGAAAYFIAWAVGRSLSYGRTRAKRIEWIDVIFWTLSGALVGVMVAIGVEVIAGHVAAAAPGGLCGRELNGLSPAEMGVVSAATVLGLSGFVLAYLIGELLYVGVASFSQKGDMDREWLARSSGWLVATAVGWALFSAIALLVPDHLDAAWASIGGALSGIVTGALGWSNLTAATTAAQSLKNISPMRIASTAAVICAVLVTSLLSLLDQTLEHHLVAWPYPWTWIRLSTVVGRTLTVDVTMMLGLIIAAIVLSRFINVNRFSMHALYRNRLVRAFLGSARVSDPDRNPDPFTGFDPDDNVHLTDLKSRSARNDPATGERLFHVINAALNVVSSKNLAWQERKAESFTMSRLFCGNPSALYRRSEYYGGPKKDVEGEGANKDGKSKSGLTLGTAMAISGAAVSPNQGYNSSPLIAFLLMLFNVRLGWWLGSPNKKTYNREGPTFSLSPALRELAGDTTDDSKWIYLSDGGHFENLGLYEMVRRRCRKIVISDAGCDPTANFEDLGNAVRKIFIDFGVSIQFEHFEIKARRNPPMAGVRFAIGTISYPDGAPGWLLYLKPTYQETIERLDVRSYAAAHAEFPHESTTDQWFSESQLESYRALGANITEYICSGGRGAPPGVEPTQMNLDTLHDVATTLMRRDTARPQPAGCCHSN